MSDIDLLGYAGSVALAETGDIAKTHQLIYSAPLTPHLRGLDEDSKQAFDLRHRAADAYYAAVFLPSFAIKPFYVLTLGEVHKLGFSVIDSSRVVSSVFYFGIALMLWVYTQSWLAFIVMLFPEVMLLGQANEPDGMSCFLLLLGLWTVFLKEWDMGVLALLVAIWVRPENALLCLLVILDLVLAGRIEIPKAGILTALCVASEVVINHYGYPWQELYHHFMGGAVGTGTSFMFTDYARSAVKGGHDLLHSPAPIFGILWLVCFPSVKKEIREVMGAVLLFSAARFMLFPPYEPRYYGLFFLTTSIAAILVIRDMSYSDLIKDAIRKLPCSIFTLFRSTAKQNLASPTFPPRTEIISERCRPVA
jgi:hypothetical protein